MIRLLEDFERLFDLGVTIDGTPIKDSIETVLRELEASAAPDWGRDGDAEALAEERLGATRFRYIPHLFPGMDLKLRLAHKLQFHLLPGDPPADAPLHLSAVLESYCHLSGDLFGWESLDDGRFLLWIVDMSGHGVRSGLASAILRVAVSRISERGAPDRLVGKLNEVVQRCVRRDGTPVYATGFFGMLSADGELEYVSAGHPPILVRARDGGVRRLESTSLPIGMFPGVGFRAATTRLATDEMMLLASDGLFELVGDDGTVLEADGVERFLREADTHHTAELTDRLYRFCGEWRDLEKLDDDLSFVAARRADGPA